MLGAIIGDIAGSQFEDYKAPAPQAGFQLFVRNCGYTDDTVTTVAIADAIMNHKSYKDSLLYWCRRYPHPFGAYGGRFQDWLESVNPQPYGSYGNGSAMRVSPVGWLFNDYHSVLDEAKKSAECSHNSEEGINGAQCVATLIYWLRTCRIRRDQIENVVKKKFGYDIPPLKDINRIGNTGHIDTTCSETVPWAIRCFLESEDFEDAIRIAIMADGDTDTKANITGAIAEAYYQVPEKLAEKAFSYLPKDMLSIVEQFCTIIQDFVI